MAVLRRLADAVPDGALPFYEGSADTLALALDYSAQVDTINANLESIDAKFGTISETLAATSASIGGINTNLLALGTRMAVAQEGLLAQAEIANGHFASLVEQLTRLANCTCIPCSGIDMCAVAEKVLRADGMID